MISNERMNKALDRFYFYSGIRFDSMEDDKRNELFSSSRKIILGKKEILYRQGSYPNGIYILQKGMLKVYQLNYDGSVQILFLYSPGEVFGHRPILSNEYHPASVAAIDDCELMFIERKNFLDVVQSSLILSNQLLVSLSHEFTVLTNRLNVFAQRGIKERLAMALLILNEKYKTSGEGDGPTEIKLMRTDLANYVGTSLENLTRTISYFKKRKLIRTKGKSIFIDHFENLFILSAIDS